MGIQEDQEDGMIFKGLNRYYYVEDYQDKPDPATEFGIGLLIGVIILYCLFL